MPKLHSVTKKNLKKSITKYLQILKSQNHSVNLYIIIVQMGSNVQWLTEWETTMTIAEERKEEKVFVDVWSFEKKYWALGTSM